MKTIKCLFLLSLLLFASKQLQAQSNDFDNFGYGEDFKRVIGESKKATTWRDYYRGIASVEDKQILIPTKKMGIIATPEGFYPNAFSVFKGEKVKFYITNTSDEASCFILKEAKLFLAANKGHITEGEAVFDKKGKYQFYCPATKVKGHITVLERPDVQRKIASEMKESPSRIWMPKEY